MEEASPNVHGMNAHLFGDADQAEWHFDVCMRLWVIELYKANTTSELNAVALYKVD